MEDNDIDPEWAAEMAEEEADRRRKAEPPPALESRRDFPKDSPILIITDGMCKPQLTVTPDHAFLLVPGGRLPFATRKPVLAMT